MHEKLLKTITNLGEPNVLIVGDFMLDTYVCGDALKISPEAPVPILKVTDKQYRCGGAGSVSADLAVLGAKAVCIGIVGQDQNGQILKEKLSETGCDITELFTTENRPTTCKQRLIGLAQRRHKQQLMRIDEEDTKPFTNEENTKILAAYKRRLPQADLVCMQDYDKGVLSSAVCREMIKLAAKNGKKIIVNPSTSNDYSKYSGVTLIAVNRKQASAITGLEIENEKTAAKSAEKLFESLKPKAVVITLDKEGAYLKTAEISEIIPTQPRSVYDVTGAADMVLATLAITLAADCSYKTAVYLANITGGIEVEKFGAVPVNIDEIINEIISQDQGKGGKIRSLESVVTEVGHLKKQDKTIVFTNGCFDVVHRGHVELLKFCKSKGDILIVGLNSDSSTKALKGPERPINNQYDRSAVLAELKTVDYIIVYDDLKPLRLLESIRPDILVKGGDWGYEGVVGKEIVERYGGKIMIAPIVKGKSSTSTIEKLNSLNENP